VAQILAAAMLVEHLGETVAAQAIRTAVDRVLDEGRVRTPDLGGTNTTERLGTAVAEALG
jgi:tartrate dehydrogenase/decarboxylase/D-malate dehydrogenase